ncbi:MAG: hypothetical protein EA391_08380, partial [Balneolaceae bacterium]
GSFDRTGWPDPIIYLFWYGLVFMGTMLNWLILHDLLKTVARRLSSRSADEIKRRFARGFLIITLITSIFTASKMVWDTHRITTEKITYTLSGAGSSFEPLTIVHISDLHADQYTGETKMQRYVDRVNSFNPDLVIFGGDLITSGTNYITAGADALAGIDATYGTWFVIGDHDYWTDTERIIHELEERGIPTLDNQNGWIDHHGATIKLTGITELYSAQVHTDSLTALLEQSRNEALRIVFSHQASDRLIEQSLQHGVHQLHGAHTHGGQIRIPIFFYPVTAARAETRYVNGNWMLGDMLLNVNNGLGFTLTPVRYHAPAQVSVITVNPEN